MKSVLYVVSKLAPIGTVLVVVGWTFVYTVLRIDISIVVVYWLSEGLAVGGVSEPFLPNLECIVEAVSFVAAATFRHVTIPVGAAAIEG